MAEPVIGITVDRAPDADRYHAQIPYAQAVAKAGATPVLIPHEPELIDRYLRLCDGFVLSGGDDPRTEAFGEPTDPRATIMDEQRQAFELALLAALDRTAHPVLGICLGMQLMALHHGGRLHQYLPDVVDATVAAQHANGEHEVLRHGGAGERMPQRGTVHSHHRQAVADAGRLSVCGVAPDGVIEAIANPSPARFYLGVQWHPERTTDAALGSGLFEALAGACVG